ncbi:GNAT family N-acetyltransferase [Aminobacter sp. NyZ550]|uniref:Diamine N-acetyltransferase n=1 Tax=Aminobacter aminovorans TaxID=83263 RepID=A0AAC9AQL7_AMIAI|nr:MULTISPECIES: GNAT family N-acetyltransferase [Aminobacter]AMS40648.1 spermidine acetyltransferase [Aminobacter aminovorans]MBB3706414.1 diamine N-acetyltransferase [Aminobacter aminovorans]WAX96786.1 GNAT family N-acetyltransferase [Aminobacter sp. NyZ550]
MTITLRPLNDAERATMLELHVAPAQQDFVASNEESIEEADDGDHCVPFAIYADDLPVGFTMYALDPDDGNYWIYRLMIDQRYQRLGYGRKALLEMLKLMATLPGCGHVTLSVVPENEMAMALYREVGFRATGEIIGGEVVFRHDLSAIG